MRLCILKLDEEREKLRLVTSEMGVKWTRRENILMGRQGMGRGLGLAVKRIWEELKVDVRQRAHRGS